MAEAVTALTATPLAVQTARGRQDRLATLHLSMSDKTGDSAIVEYIDGQQVIHHSRDHQVMTNSPIFEAAGRRGVLKGIGGTVMLPGTNRRRPVRPGVVLHQRHPRPTILLRGRRGAQHGAQCLCAVRDFDRRRGEHLLDAVAHSGGPQEPSVRLRIGSIGAQHLWVDLKNFDFTKCSKLDLGQG